MKCKTMDHSTFDQQNRFAEKTFWRTPTGGPRVSVKPFYESNHLHFQFDRDT